jgi:hypothetical protein
MQILLICKGEYRYSFPEIAETLKQRYGCSVQAMTFTTPAARMVDRTNVFSEVHDLGAYLQRRVPEYDLQECLERLREFDLSSDSDRLNTTVFGDRILREYSFERIAKIVAGVIEFWESLFATVRFDAVVGEIACTAEWVAWSFANRQGIPYLAPFRTSVANRLFFLGSPKGTWEPMEKVYQSVKRRSLNSHEYQLAEEFVQAFRATRPKPLISWDQRSPLRPNLRQLVRRIERIPFRVQTYLENGEFEIGSYHGTPPWRPVWEDALRVMRHLVSEARMFERGNREGRKAYFPLHMQPEFTTDVRAPFHTNQVALIQNISKCLPFGYWLQVKEHPSMRGDRSLSFYRELKKLYNVQLLSPSVDSHSLIQQSDVVLTITGSTAWEAILYEKPVIAFGPLCYGFCDLIYHCANITDLPAIFLEATQRFKRDHDLVLKFIWAFLASAYELEWDDSIRSTTVFEQKNLDRIAKAIISEISLRMPSRAAKSVSI